MLPHVDIIVQGEPMPWERAEPTIRRKHTGKQYVQMRTADRTAEYEQRIRLIAQRDRPHNWPMRCRYRVGITVYRSERGDVDNYSKSVLDALNPRRAKYVGKGAKRRIVRDGLPGVLWVDDGRVYELRAVIVDVVPENVHLAVTITAYPVRCKNVRCGHAETLYPDGDGRCEACQGKK